MAKKVGVVFPPPLGVWESTRYNLITYNIRRYHVFKTFSIGVDLLTPFNSVTVNPSVRDRKIGEKHIYHLGGKEQILNMLLSACLCMLVHGHTWNIRGLKNILFLTYLDGCDVTEGYD